MITREKILDYIYRTYSDGYPEDDWVELSDGIDVNIWTDCNGDRRVTVYPTYTDSDGLTCTEGDNILMSINLTKEVA